MLYAYFFYALRITVIYCNAKSFFKNNCRGFIQLLVCFQHQLRYIQNQQKDQQLHILDQQHPFALTKQLDRSIR